jgi:ribulose-phosphate 3-epimerase
VPWGDWIRGIEVEPSIYAADFARLGDQLESLLRADARIFHFDVGDGHFVPPVTIGPVVLQSIAPLVHGSGGVLDCHLMVEAPERHFEQIREAGGDSVTVHFEVCPRLPATVAGARALGLQVGLAFNPETEPESAAAAAMDAGVDLVLCMSINPGFSGQEFMPRALDRLQTLRGSLPDSMHVQVDGGIGPENVRAVRDAGANLLVAGTAVFGDEDVAGAYRRLAQAAA